MSWLFYLSIATIFGLGSLTTYTDLKHHKAYNRDLLLFTILGLAIQVSNLLTGYQDLRLFLINLVITLVVSFAFFAIRIWAAGDAKLFTTMVLLIPYQFYKMNDTELFPAFFVLGLIFTTALFYVSLESIFLFLKEISVRKNISLQEFLPHFSKDFFLSWLMGYLAADTFTGLLTLLGQDFLINNRYLFVIVQLLLITALFTLIDSVRKKIFFTVSCGLIRLILAGSALKYSLHFSFSFVFFTVVVILFRTFTDRYNYKTISTGEVREGQILAKSSLIFMLPSMVKDLPKWSDESTRYRLSSIEVEAIKRWEKSKYGRNTVTIVRHIPFAPFIFLGTLIFLSISFYIGVI